MAHGHAATGADYDESFYQGYSGRLNQYWWARRFYAHLIRRYRRSGKLLEVGCGLGHVLMRLENDFETYGVDISPFAVKKAQVNAPRTKLSVATAEEVKDLPGAPFDVIAAFHVVEHLEDPAAVIRDWAQTLAPAGMLVFATPNPDAPFAKRKGAKWHGNHPTHIALKTVAEWQRLAIDAGLSIRKVFGDGLWDVPYVPLIPNIMQRGVFGLPAAVQVLTTLPFIPASMAESVIIIAERPKASA